MTKDGDHAMSELKPKSISINEIERLEFVGVRHDDGSVTALGRKMEDWPERTDVGRCYIG